MKRIILLLLTIALHTTGIAKIIYVNPAATGANNGTSWTNAYTSFEFATWLINPNDEMHIAGGTYEVSYVVLEVPCIVRGSFDPLTNKQDFKAHPTKVTRSGTSLHFEIGENSVSPSYGEVIVESIQFYDLGRSSIQVINRASIVNCLFVDATIYHSSSFLPDYSMPPLLTVVNCTFANSPDSTGELIYEIRATSEYINCTMLNNSSKAICFRMIYNRTKLTNCIVWGPSDREVLTANGTLSCTLVLNRNIMAPVHPSIQLVMTNPALDTMRIDPLFSNPAGGDLSLRRGSPAINIGDSTVLASHHITHDLYGRSRKSGCTIDLGAQEYQHSPDEEFGQLPDTNGILYVNKAGTYNIWGDIGSSWEKAQPSIENAFTTANTCPLVKEIRIASGNYMENRLITTRTYNIRGSFVAETDQQDWVTTRIQIDLSSFMRLEFPGPDTAQVEGIRFNETWISAAGTLNLSHCVFNNSYLFVYADLWAYNCQFNSIRDNLGHQINNYEHVHLTNCTIWGNTGIAAIANFDGALWINNSILWGNPGVSEIYTNNGAVTLNRNIIRNNITTEGAPSIVYANGPAVDTRSEDPRFKDPDVGDFRPMYGSPANNRGSNELYETTNKSINTDIDLAGKKRMHGASIDLGAFERVVPQLTLQVDNVTATYGDPSVEPAPTTTANLPIHYLSDDNNIATVFTDTDNKQKIKIGHKGLTTIKAVQEGNEDYDPSDTVNFTVTVNPKPITITGESKSKIYGEADPALTYSVAPPLIGSDVLSGNITRTAGQDAGDYPITQGNLNNDNYNISFIPGTFTINKAPQQITWSQSLQYGCDGSTGITLTGFSSSGLPVQYNSSNTSVATTSGNQLTIVSAGATSITAAQPGNNNYLPASELSKELNVRLPAHLLVKHWNDVLMFDNSSKAYTSWQWYKNGSPVNGATSQYYYESGNLQGEYFAAVKNKAGETLTTCPVNITPGLTGTLMTVFPNPAAPGQNVTVNANYTAAQLQGATITVTNHTGSVVSTHQQVTPQTAISMPLIQGLYVIRLKLTNGINHAINILIKQ